MCEALSSDVISLPVHAYLDEPTQDRVIQAVRDALATEEYRGVVTNYRSDGRGNMAHEAEIVCFDGTSRVPVLATRYVFPVR